LANTQPAGAERHGHHTVALVDDEPLIRSALAPALHSAGLKLIGEASNGETAIELVLEQRPDVVLTDIRLPGLSGVEMIKRLGLLAPASKVLVLARSEHNRVVEAILAGANGYILKSSPPEQIADAVRATAEGECILSPQIAGKLLERIRELDIPIATGADNAASSIRAALTERELEIFKLLASGANNQQIAHQINLSPHTISNHIKNILQKLHLENRIQAAVQAVRTGIS
jgi:two-component system nitrate/nitrite response regulator NarL